MSGHIYDRYLRDHVHSMWCPGCGNGIVLQALIRAIDECGTDKKDVVIVSGIGCSSRAVNYLKIDAMHTLHGRAIPHATGIKLADPKLKVIVITGDGDCTSIGGNHFIHACRRNIDLTIIVMNNSNYGMTGGQYSPTTPLDSITKTSAYGSYEPPFDICRRARSSGATYVARAATYDPLQMKRLMKDGLAHHGLSVIDCFTDCPSLYGRLNRKGDAAAMIMAQKERIISVDKIKESGDWSLSERMIVTGCFVDSDERREYTDIYEEYRRKVGKAE